MAPSSAGVTNLRQSCVPTGSQRSRYSAATLAARNDCGVRLSVERNSLPPGSSSPASVARKAAGIRDVLDHLERGDDREARTLRQQVLGDAGPVAEGQVLAGGMGAGRLDRLRRRRPGPERRSRGRASASAATPAPQPTSSSRRRWGEAGECSEYSPSPCGRGLGEGAPPVSDPSRSAPRSTPPAPGSSGAAAASGRSDPTSAPRARRTAATSAGETVMPGMVAPAVPHQYDHRQPPTDNRQSCHAS